MSIIVIPLKDILDNIYSLLRRNPTSQSSLSLGGHQTIIQDPIAGEFVPARNRDLPGICPSFL
jgi:hypothetical protein